MKSKKRVIRAHRDLHLILIISNRWIKLWRTDRHPSHVRFIFIFQLLGYIQYGRVFPGFSIKSAGSRLTTNIVTVIVLLRRTQAGYRGCFCSSGLSWPRMKIVFNGAKKLSLINETGFLVPTPRVRLSLSYRGYYVRWHVYLPGTRIF